MRKKILLLIVFMSIPASFIFAQDSTAIKKDTAWKSGGFLSLNINQVSLNNWAAGGESSFSLAGLFNYFANYRLEGASWDNSLDLGYGVIKADGDPMHKNEDKIELNSKYGQLAQGSFFYSGLLNFRTQFAAGYNYPNDSVEVSNFTAPAYITLALGMDYKPNATFSLFLSPATGRITIVANQILADSGAFGVDKAEFDAAGNKIKNGKNTRIEFGAYLAAKYQNTIMENVDLLTKITLFDNYTDKIASNRLNVDVNWDFLLTMKVNKYISASIFANAIYDHDIDIPTYETINGVKTEVSKGPKTQFKELIGIGFGYRF
ncbi:MAG: DUF3078 domain-containing protein [Ignavibacteriae bacterium]|nr:DUF3078 domain-containing protein [Ignavibacteriota bacterium]